MPRYVPRVGTVKRLVPSGYDVFDDKDGRIGAWSGQLVRVIQPHGCPKNGTMGHCYVESVADKTFIGLVCIASLQPK